MADSSDYIGKTLGNYRLIRHLGTGGFADVYLGEHVRFQTWAAIKVLKARLIDKNRDAFLAEARAIAQLDHSHIVKVLDFSVEDHIPFLVMEFAPNGTLKQRHPLGKVGRVPLRTVVSYVSQVAQALQYAHDRNIIHRDVKPENMLLGPDGQIWLSDFGLAVFLQGISAKATQGGGTIYYEAPEQIEGNPCPASDQYSLGVVVYEWLSGRRLFHGNYLLLQEHHLHTPPPSLLRRVPTLPNSIEIILEKALKKDPQQRYGRIQAFADALDEGYRDEQEREKANLEPQSAPVTKHRFGSRKVFLVVLAALVLLSVSARVLFAGSSAPGYTSTSLPDKRSGTATAIAIAAATVYAQATSTAQSLLYRQATLGVPALNSLLTSQDDNHWDEYIGKNTSCSFSKNGYVAQVTQSSLFVACLARATNFSNFAFQVDMIFTKGGFNSFGGIVFRVNAAKTNLYYFKIGTDGSYDLILLSRASSQRLSMGISSFIRPNQTNTITVIAKAEHFYFYIDQVYITTVNDSTLNQGAIGVTAEDLQNPAEVTFRDAKVWPL